MFLITRRVQFGPQTFLWDVQAPDVARAARPGHFVMARIDERGERIPLTVADFNVDRGTVTVVIQAVGKTTHEMMTLASGRYHSRLHRPPRSAQPHSEVGRHSRAGGRRTRRGAYLPAASRIQAARQSHHLHHRLPHPRPDVLGRAVPRLQRRTDRRHRRWQLRTQRLRDARLWPTSWAAKRTCAKWSPSVPFP